MKLDLQLYDDRRMFCYERAIVSTMLYFCRHYQFMFLYTLDFTFTGNKKMLLGNRIGAGEWRFEDLLERYHGVSIHTSTNRSMDITQFMQTIRFELQNNRPVFVEEDILITGISEHTNMFYIYRIISNRQDMIGARELYDMSDAFLTFEITGKDISGVDIKHIMSPFRDKNVVGCYTKSIEKFADHFLAYFDMEAEMEGNLQFDEVPVIKNMINIGRGRRLFKMLLEFMDQTSNIQSFTDVCDMLIEVENKWLMVTSVLMRAYHIGLFREKDKINIYGQLVEIADYENSLIDRILSIVYVN